MRLRPPGANAFHCAAETAPSILPQLSCSQRSFSFSGIMFEFVGEQVLVMAQDATCLMPSRGVQRRHDEGEDAS
jgi:hypothetical protein